MIIAFCTKQDKELILEKESTIFVRGIAIIFIMLHHLVQRTVATDNHVCVLNLVGYIMVGVFFLLSGYGNTFSVKNNKSIKSLIKKCLRLIITFWFICIIYLILLAIFKGQLYSINNILKALFTITMPYYTIWYLKIQIMAYILLYFSYNVFKKNTDLIVLGLTLLSVIIFRMLNFGAYWWNSVLCFGVGCVIAERKNIFANFLEKTNKYIIILLSVILFLILFYIGNRCKEVMVVSSISFCMMITIILYFFKFKSKIINFIGSISLEIYLWHLVFIIILFDKGKNIINLNINLIMYFGLSIGVSFITNKLISKIIRK